MDRSDPPAWPGRPPGWPDDAPGWPGDTPGWPGDRPGWPDDHVLPQPGDYFEKPDGYPPVVSRGSAERPPSSYPGNSHPDRGRDVGTGPTSQWQPGYEPLGQRPAAGQAGLADQTDQVAAPRYDPDYLAADGGIHQPDARYPDRGYPGPGYPDAEYPDAEYPDAEYPDLGYGDGGDQQPGGQLPGIQAVGPSPAAGDWHPDGPPSGPVDSVNYGYDSAEPVSGRFGLAPRARFEAEPHPRSRRVSHHSHAHGRRRFLLGIGCTLVVVMVVAAVFIAKGNVGRSGQSSRQASQPSRLRALAAPQRIGAYSRDPQAEQQLGITHGEQYLTQISLGHISGVVAAVYDTGGSASAPYRVAVIAGRLVNSPVAGVIKSFTQQESKEGNAPAMIAAGPLGGQAACAGNGSSGICVWADHDTVGVVVSATTNTRSLAQVMLTIRSGVESLPA